MKKLGVLCLILRLSFGSAEGEYVGGGLSVYVILPFVSLQAGLDIAEDLSLRANIDTLLLVNVVSTDILYTFYQENPRLYAGAGPDMIVLLAREEDSDYPAVFFGAHGTLGAEFRQDTLGYFLEAQPGLGFLSASQRYIRFRAGLNVYY